MAFESVLSRGETPRIEDFLGKVAPEQRPALLKELLLLEAEHRSRAGHTPSREEYAPRFQDFASVLDTVFPLFPSTVLPTDQVDPYATQAFVADADHTSRPRSLDECGRFRIVKPHARGGLGEVFVAEDGELHRNVALKRIRGQFVGDADSRSRFLREAEITGNLEHPGIVPIYGLGKDEAGRPYYAMRFIQGESLKETIERFHDPKRTWKDAGEKQLELRKLLQRFIDVCNAMEYAHSRGVIHRDLKPANIMVGKYGETLVVDWGLAKPMGQVETHAVPDVSPLQLSGDSDSAQTQMGQAVGTPQYMSPEQASGRHDKLTAATDVYALGAVLHSILSGRPPVAGHSVGEVLDHVLKGIIAPLPTTTPSPLASICRRAMALKPADRYASARALADDVERWLADDPVAAHRESFSERAARWARTHRTAVTGAVALTATALAALVLGLIAVSREQRETERQRVTADEERHRAETKQSEAETARAQESIERRRADEQRLLAEARKKDADTQRDEAEWTAYQANIQAADAEWDRNQPTSALQRLAACSEKLRGWEHDYLTAKFHRGRTVLDRLPSIKTVAFHPEGNHIVTGDFTNNLRITDLRDGSARILPCKIPIPNSVQFSRDGKRIISGSVDGSVAILDVATGEMTHAFDGQQSTPVMSTAFSFDGKRCAACGGQTLRVWDVETGALISMQTLTFAAATSVQFTRDDRRLLVAGGLRMVFREVETEKEIKAFQNVKRHITTAVLSPDDERVVTLISDGSIALWDVESGRQLFDLRGHTSRANSIAFSPDGRTLVSASQDTTLKQWNTATGQEIRTLYGHSRPVLFAAMSPQGDRVVSGGYDQPAILWEVDVPNEPQTFIEGFGNIFAAAISPDGGTIAYSGSDGDVVLQQPISGSVPRTLRRQVPILVNWDISFTPTGDRIAVGSSDGNIRIWSTATNAVLQTLHGHTGPVLDIAVSRDGKRLASCAGDMKVKLWDLERGELLATLEDQRQGVAGVAVSPDGMTVASVADDGAVNLWHSETGKSAGILKGRNKGKLFCVEFSPDGTLIAAGSGDRTIKLWNVAEGGDPRLLAGHTGAIYSLGFSRDGKRIVSGGDDRTIKLWDVVTGREMLTLRGHRTMIKKVSFSPNGDKIISCEAERGVKVWSAVNDPAPKK